MGTSPAQATSEVVSDRFEPYQALVELSPYAMLVDVNDRIVFTNAAFCRLIGATGPAQLLGQSTSLFIPAEDRAAFVENNAATQRARGPTSMRPERWIRLDGTIINLESMGAPLPWQGEPGVQLVLRDVTELFQMEHSLRQVQIQMRAVVETVQDFAIFSLGRNGRVESWNVGAQRLFGFLASEIIGKPFDVIFTPEDQARGAPSWEIEQAAQTGIAKDERWHQRKDGSRLFVNGLLIAVRNELGDLEGFTKIAQDHTSRKTAEDALKESEARYRQLASELENKVIERTRHLEESTQAWEGFCYSIAHDLRAPLRTISGFADALVEDCSAALDPRGKDYTQRMAAAAHRMDDFIQDLLDFGRLAHVELPRRPLDLKQALNEVLGELMHEVSSARAQVELQGTFPKVLANPAATKQILINLLTNAIKFVPPGLNPRVEIHAEERDTTVRLWIRDYGIGIRPEHHERVFRLFERLHSQSEYPGTGAGLAIVRRAIERMGGQVGLQSAPGQGSAFWIELARAD